MVINYFVWGYLILEAVVGREDSRKKKIVLMTILLLLASCGCSDRTVLPSEEFEEQETVEEYEVSVAPLLTWEDPDSENLAGMLQRECSGMMVQLEAGRYLGSGILYKQEETSLVILTAAHVLLDVAEVVKVTFADGWVFESMDFELSRMADLAVVRVPLDQIPPDQATGYYLANVDKTIYDNILPEDGCIVMGCRTGVAEDAYEGFVLEPWVYMEDYSQYMMWISAAGKPGMSGGGLFDRRGHFLGILSGRNEDGEWAVVPLIFVLAEYS